MEIANVKETSLVRPAVQRDARAVNRLLHEASYSHLHVDWHLPVDWLGTPGFVVYETRATLLASSRLQGCLAVAADPPPAAWVRAAAIVHNRRAVTILSAMLTQVLPFLQANGVTQLGWLLLDDWPEEWLSALRFECVNWVETYVKDDLNLPEVRPVPVEIRPAQAEELAVLAEIEAAAFAPLWRHSVYGLAQAGRQAISFDVALLAGRIVGFQYSAPGENDAHLVRLTVHPDAQGLGVGSALLAHAIAGYRRRGLRSVSLNTQVDNFASHSLYRKFGFYAAGHRFPVWTLSVTEH